MKYSKEDLERYILLEKKPYSKIGEIYNVSGNAIKKAAKRLNINLPIRRKISTCENFSHKSIGDDKRKRTLLYAVSDEKFIDIIKSSYTWKSIGEKIGYKSKVLSSNVKNSIKNRADALGVKIMIDYVDICKKTKGELFRYRKNWQSARSDIRKNAALIYRKNHPNPCCAVCGYTHHTEIAHIKAVSDFDDNALICEINSIDNLIELCPNHHWEYDHGILKIEDIIG